MSESVPPEATRNYPGPAEQEDPAAAGPATLSRVEPVPPSDPPTERVSLPDGPATGEWLATPVEATEQLSAPPTGPANRVPLPPTLLGPAARQAAARPRAVAGYEILGELGRGGMGVVYQARQVGLNRLVALKMILAGAHAGAAELLRFRTEAEAVARLQHPNIVQVFDVGEQDGCPYFSLELVDGGSLADLLDATPLPQRRAAELIETLARAMHYAHEQGIVHRDLKPANVLLQRDFTAESAESAEKQTRPEQPSPPSALSALSAVKSLVPKITDFGLAKRLDSEQGPTMTGSIMGTPSYMAPEQAAGRLADIGPLTDVYSLGAILYECLTGRPPFRAPSPLETMHQVVNTEPVPPARLQPEVARDLETVCLKCLHKEPKKRYGSARELADDLHRFLADEPIQARPVGAWERGVKWARRRPAVAALAGVSAAAVVGLLGMTVWHYTELRTTLDEARTSWHREEEFRHGEEERARLAEQERQEGERLAGLRAQVEGLLAAGEQDLDRENWKDAKTRLLDAQARLGTEPKLADLRPRANGLLENCSRLETQRQDVRGKVERFQHRYDDALFHGTLFTGVDVPANLEACQAAAREALGLFGVTEAGGAGPVFPERYLSDDEKKAVTAGCYDLLLVLAEAVAQPLPGEAPARRQERVARALAILERAGKVGVTTHAYHLRRSKYLAELGEQERAEAEQRRARSVAPASANDHFLIGDERYRAEDLPAAMASFHRALERDAKHFWARYFLAVCYLKSERPREAIAYLTSCLSQRDFLWVYLLRGYAHGEVGDFPAAEADFQEVARRDPNAYGLYVNRGLTRLHQGKVPEAVADFRRAVRLKPEQYQAYVDLAEAYRLRKDLDEALRQLGRAIDLAPAVARNHWRRALVREERGDLADALADLRRAVRLEDPGSRLLAEYQVARGRILHRQHQDEEALAACDAALRSNPDHPAAHALRADVLLARDRGPEALADLDQYLRQERQDPRAYRERGFERARRGDYAGAIADYSHSLDLDPKSSPARRARGWAYLNAAAEVALADFDMALAGDRDNADLYAGRGYALALLGRYQEAVHDAEEAVRRDRPDAEPRQRLALRYNTACVCAQAAGQAAGAANDPDGPKLTAAYAERAVKLLREALELLPPAERAPYLQQARAEPALAPIRRGGAFEKLVTDYGK